MIFMNRGAQKTMCTETGFTLVETLVYVSVIGLIASSLVLLSVSAAEENCQTIDGVISAYASIDD
jgi:type II secretory pathway pseudopilin PulG